MRAGADSVIAYVLRRNRRCRAGAVRRAEARSTPGDGKICGDPYVQTGARPEPSADNGRRRYGTQLDLLPLGSLPSSSVEQAINCCRHQPPPQAPCSRRSRNNTDSLPHLNYVKPERLALRRIHEYGEKWVLPAESRGLRPGVYVDILIDREPKLRHPPHYEQTQEPFRSAVL